MMTPTPVAAGSQLLQHFQARHVRQVHVEQDQLRPQFAGRRQRLGAGAGHADRAEAVDLFDEPAVDLGDHEVVVDDEHVTHRAACLRCVDGCRAAAPRTAHRRPGPSVTSTVPPCCARDQPHQRQPDSPAAGHVGLRRDTAGEDLLAKMFGHTGSGVGDRDRQAVRVVDVHGDDRAGSDPTDTSTALSIRLPSSVITSVASAGSSAARWDSGRRAPAPRRSRRPATSSRSAARRRRDRRSVW